jgi:subtilisin-like proprotein convertase family protein
MREIPILLLLAGMLPGADLVLRDGGGVRRFADTGERVAAPDAGARRGGPPAAADLPVLRLAGGDPKDPHARRVVHPSVVVRADGPAAAGALAALGGGMARPGRGGLWILDYPDAAAALAALPALETAGARPEPMLGRQQAKRSDDPLFADQWHLTAADVVAAWTTTTGSGVNVAVIDDGLQVAHPDLAANCPPVASHLHHNFNGGTQGVDDPSPISTNGDRHGTACAGLIGAVQDNTIGVSGVAPGVRLFGLRLIAAPSTDADEAEALSWRSTASSDAVQVSSNSWGPPNPYYGPGSLTAAAIADTVRLGRGGLGGIICFAAGNDGDIGDDANADGYANLRQVIAVGGILKDGTPAPYSEPGANLVVSAPTGPAAMVAGQGLVTTDVTGAAGYNTSTTAGDYYVGFNGTSGSCPQVAGICALMLAASPRLGWRDVQEILIRTATQNDPADPGWSVNGAGWHFNHLVGAGQVDAAAAVAMARDWRPLAGETRTIVDSGTLNQAIPDNDLGGISRALPVTVDLRCEHVTLAVAITHTYRADLRILLTSPSGTQSIMARPNGPDAGADLSWTYMTVRCWGESSRGTWTVRIIDEVAADAGTLVGALITVYGTPRSLAPADAAGVLQTVLTEHGTQVGQSTVSPFAVPYDGLPAGRHHLALTTFTAVGQSTTRHVVDVPGRHPTITSRPTLTVTEGAAYAYAATTAVPAAGTIAWSLPVAPAGMTVDAAGGIAWTPAVGTAPSGGDVIVPVVVRASLMISGTEVGIDDQFILVTVHSAIGG